MKYVKSFLYVVNTNISIRIKINIVKSLVYISIFGSGKYNMYYFNLLSLKFVWILSYNHTRQPTNPRPMPTNFYGLVGYDRVKNYPLWLKSVSIPDQHQLYPRCIPDAPTLKSRSSRPTPVLPADQSRSARPTPDLFRIQLRSLRSI